VHRPLLLAFALALVACGGSSTPPPAIPGVRMWEGADHTSEGEVVIPGDAATNYAQLSDYARWPKIFSDVASVEDQGRAPDDASEEKVLLVTKAGQNNNLRFHNDAAHHVVKFHDTGGMADVWAEIGFEDAGTGKTRVHVRLYADVHGFTSLFVTDARLRDQRQKKLSSDLADIQRFFLTAERAP
jgi:hypothetical protein